MHSESRTLPARADEYWLWFAVALYLLVTVDLVTTFGAIARFGIAAEANPLVAALLEGPMWLLVAVHVAVVVAVTYGFDAVLQLFGRTPPRFQSLYTTVVEAWLALMVAAGLLLFANNVSAVVYGVSLVSLAG